MTVPGVEGGPAEEGADGGADESVATGSNGDAGVRTHDDDGGDGGPVAVGEAEGMAEPETEDGGEASLEGAEGLAAQILLAPPRGDVLLQFVLGHGLRSTLDG